MPPPNLPPALAAALDAYAEAAVAVGWEDWCDEERVRALASARAEVERRFQAALQEERKDAERQAMLFLGATVEIHGGRMEIPDVVLARLSGTCEVWHDDARRCYVFEKTDEESALPARREGEGERSGA